jgi:hypothetical protein
MRAKAAKVKASWPYAGGITAKSRPQADAARGTVGAAALSPAGFDRHPTARSLPTTGILMRRSGVAGEREKRDHFSNRPLHW